MILFSRGEKTIEVKSASDFKDVLPTDIKGPKSLSDDIAIIGAGPSGIHMAYLLKEKGFKNVKILERTNRLGGKSTSIKYRGTIHELGTVYISKDYEENVISLLKKFTNSTLVPIPMASVWADNSTSGIPFATYIFLKLKSKYKDVTLDNLKKMYVSTIYKYIALHRSLFGEYKGELMPEPSEHTKSKISGSFYDFLKRNELEDLKDLLTASFTLQGYGQLDEVPALYGLLWNTPRLMQSIVSFLNGDDGGLYILSNGFESLWNCMANTLDLDITYNISVRYIHIDDNAHDINGKTNKIFVYYKDDPKGPIKIESYDFLIWTPPVSKIVKLIGGNEIKEEKKMFSSMEHTYYTTSLVDVYESKRSVSPVDWWFDRIYSKQNMAVWASRESYASTHGYHGYNYAEGKYPTGDDADKKRTSVFYQYSKKKPNKRQLRSILKQHLKNYGATRSKMLYQRKWPYFERFNFRDAERGHHWKVLRLQGEHKIWFCGSSVSFESVKSVVEYNQLLVSRMEKPEVRID